MFIAPQVILPGLTPGFRASAAADDGRSERTVVDMASAVLDAADVPGPALESLVSVVLRRLDDVGIQRATLLGEGFSATVALQLAARHPDRVEQLVLCSPLGYISPLSGGRQTPTSLGDAVRGLYSAAPSRTREAIDVLTGQPLAAMDAVTQTYVAACADAGVRQAAAVLADWLDGREFDLTARTDGDWIRKVNHQVSLIWGRDDLWASLDSAFYLTRRLRHVRLRVIPHCGHLVSLEAGRQVESHQRSLLAEDPVSDAIGA